MSNPALSFDAKAFAAPWALLDQAQECRQRREFRFCAVAVVESQNFGRWRLGHSPGRLGFGYDLGMGTLDGIGTQSSPMVCGLTKLIQALTQTVKLRSSLC